MRIAVVVPGGVDRSGEVRIIPALVALLAQLSARHDVQVFALAQEPRAGRWPLAGAQIHNIGRPMTRLRTLRAIRAAHAVAPFAVVQAIWSGPCGLVAVSAGRLLGIPSLVHVAGGELSALPDIGYGGARRWRSRLRERLTLNAAARVSAASTPLIERIAAFGVQAQRVPLGVDLGSWPARAPLRREPGSKARLIHVASLNRVKDQPTLLRAAAMLAHSGSDFQLDIVGEDTLCGQIQALAAAQGLSAQVRFHGFLTQRLLRPLMEAAHLAVVSSRHEAGPVVVLEAAAAGVPTVGTAVGHIAEWAPQAAIAVPVADPAALARAIGVLLADEESRLAIARAAQLRATREDAVFSARCFEALYAQLTSGGH